MRPIRLPVSDLKECPYTVVNLQVPTSKVNSRRVSPKARSVNMEMIVLSICNVQAKGTAFSSLVAEVLNQIAKTCHPVNLQTPFVASRP